jgi:hypothetical protein
MTAQALYPLIIELPQSERKNLLEWLSNNVKDKAKEVEESEYTKRVIKACFKSRVIDGEWVNI